MDIRDLVEEEDLFDPLEAEDDESKEQQEEFEGPDDTPLVAPAMDERPEKPETDYRPASVRIADLIEEMPGQKRVLLRLVDYCREPKSGKQMDARTEELKENNFSVFSPVVFRELLEEAGAIEYLLAEGEATTGEEESSENLQESDCAQAACTPAEIASSDGDSAPADQAYCCDDAPASSQDDPLKVKSETLLNGDEELQIEYLEIEEERPGLWVATEDGLAAVDGQDDFGHIKTLLGKEPQYEGIYNKILGFCSDGSGRSAKELDSLVNNDPALQEPRRYSGYFVGRLEREGAVEWEQGWVTTEAGMKMLEQLAS